MNYPRRCELTGSRRPERACSMPPIRPRHRAVTDARLARYQALLAACDHLTDEQLRALIRLALRLPDLPAGELELLLELTERGR